MRKKYVILIIIGLFLVIGGYFGYKGFNLYINIYSIEKSSDMKDYFKGLKIGDTLTVKLNNQTNDEKLSIKGISIKNENHNFVLSNEILNTEEVKGFELNDDKSTKILMSKTLFNFYEAIGKDEKWIHKMMEENNINNDLDLLLYAIKNKDNKPTIFSSIKEMKFYNYIYYLYIQTCSLKLESIKLIDGDLKGYIVETKDMPIREINLIDNSNKYNITLWNKEYFTYDYIKELLNTVVIGEEKENNNTNNETIGMDISTEKTCTYTETYTFIDYYENKDLFSSESSFNIILEKFQSKTGPIIETLNSSNFSKDFIKGKNYEVTYKTTIDYSKGSLYENKQILKIEQTDKQGLDQIQENCILK